MSRVKVKLQDSTPARVIFIETDATIGAKIGTDLYMPDGKLATAASLAAFLGVNVTGGANATNHKLLKGLTVGDDHPQYTRKDTLTTRGDIYVRGAANVQRLGLGAADYVLSSDGTDVVWSAAAPKSFTRGATFVSATEVEVPTNDVAVVVPVNSVIIRATILTTGGTGSCVVDVRKDTYANFPPGGGDSICGAAKPTISAGIKTQDSTLTGWTTSVAAGDVLLFVLESADVFTSIAVSLELQPT